MEKIKGLVDKYKNQIIAGIQMLLCVIAIGGAIKPDKYTMKNKKLLFNEKAKTRKLDAKLKNKEQMIANKARLKEKKLKEKTKLKIKKMKLKNKLKAKKNKK